MAKLTFWRKKPEEGQDIEQVQSPPEIQQQSAPVQAEERKPKLWKKVEKQKILERVPLYNRYQEKKKEQKLKYARWKESLKQLRVFGVGFQYGVCFGIPVGFYRFIKGKGSISSLYRCPLGFGIVLGTLLYSGTKALDSYKKKD